MAEYGRWHHDSRLVQAKGSNDKVEVKVVAEQRNGEHSPMTAACDTFEESPPMTAVVVIPYDVSAFEASLGDVMPTVGDAQSVGARHDLRPEHIVRCRAEVRHFRQDCTPGRDFHMQNGGQRKCHFLQSVVPRLIVNCRQYADNSEQCPDICLTMLHCC